MDEDMRKFHQCFQSCNEVSLSLPSQTKRWCYRCEKCAFVFLLLSSWLPPSQVQDIFEGVDLFSRDHERTMKQIYLDLLGLERDRHKPFECVGTPAEARCALRLSYRRNQESSMNANNSILIDLENRLSAFESESIPWTSWTDDEICNHYLFS